MKIGEAADLLLQKAVSLKRAMWEHQSPPSGSPPPIDQMPSLQSDEGSMCCVVGDAERLGDRGRCHRPTERQYTEDAFLRVHDSTTRRNPFFAASYLSLACSAT